MKPPLTGAHKNNVSTSNKRQNLLISSSFKKSSQVTRALCSERNELYTLTHGNEVSRASSLTTHGATYART